MPERVHLFTSSSGAGCGHDDQSLSVEPALVDPESKSVLESLLEANIGGPLDGWWTNPTSNPAAAIRLFRHDGKPYVLARGENGSGNTVYSFWQDRRETWCEYRFIPRHTIRVTYPPESWPVPTPMPDGKRQ